MATFTGTGANEVITPGALSGTVARSPAGAFPSGAADLLIGGDGNDTLNGGGGSDTSLGGNGDDYIFAVLGTPESIDGGAGNDTLDTTPLRAITSSTLRPVSPISPANPSSAWRISSPASATIRWWARGAPT